MFRSEKLNTQALLISTLTQIYSSIIRELRQEAGDEPEQLQTNELFQEDKMGRKRMAEEARIRESEENNFIRIARKKGDRYAF